MTLKYLIDDHLAEGRHIPGIFVLNAKLSVGENLEELLLIADASFEDEYQNQIYFLPLT